MLTTGASDDIRQATKKRSSSSILSRRKRRSPGRLTPLGKDAKHGAANFSAALC